MRFQIMYVDSVFLSFFLPQPNFLMGKIFSPDGMHGRSNVLKKEKGERKQDPRGPAAMMVSSHCSFLSPFIDRYLPFR